MKFHLTKEKCVVAEGAKAFELATTDVCFGYLAGAARIFSLKTLAVRLGYRGRGGGGRNDWRAKRAECGQQIDSL